MLLDPVPHPQYGPGSRTAKSMRIRINNTQICCIHQVTNLVSGKLALRYSGPALDAMKAVALAAKARSLADFQVQLSHTLTRARSLADFQVQLFAHIDQGQITHRLPGTTFCTHWPGPDHSQTSRYKFLRTLTRARSLADFQVQLFAHIDQGQITRWPPGTTFCTHWPGPDHSPTSRYNFSHTLTRARSLADFQVQLFAQIDQGHITRRLPGTTVCTHWPVVIVPVSWV